jgi:phospholipid-binding lipoprotein MlaA
MAKKMLYLCLVLAGLLQAMTVQAGNKPDPLEPANRAILKFNDGLDKAIISPVTRVYMAVTPDVVEKHVDLFFANLMGVTSVANSFAQFKFKKGLRHLGRFTVNSTLGVLGVFDVATRWGLNESAEDFGQTLGFWGVPAGPYLVLPLFGPSTLRDTGGLIVDTYSDPVTYYPTDSTANMAVRGVELLATRAGLFRYDALMTGDRYSTMRELYLQNREYQVKDGAVVDTFTDAFEDDSEFLDESF